MEDEMIPKELEIMVQKIMEKEGVQKYTIQLEGRTGSGDNYLADVIFIKVTSDKNEQLYSLVIKTAKKSEEMRKMLPVTTFYNREIIAYSVVFPTFQDFIQENNNPFNIDFIPKVYFTESKLMLETVILENMKKSGYQMLDKTKPWTLEHTLLAMEHYGKYHGMSVALKDRKPRIFEKISKNLTNIGAEFAKGNDLQKYYQDSWKDVTALFEKTGRKELAKKYEGFEMDFTDLMTGVNTADKDKFVITHGDCWNNNFMFKYQDETQSKPTKICFLDFQLITLDNPIKDLSYIIYTTCDKTCLDHFDLLVQTYYRSMSDTVKSLGSNLEDTLTYQDLMEYWRKHGKYGLLAAISIIKLCLANKSDAPDLEEISKTGGDMTKIFNINVDNEEYSRRILDALTHFADRCL